MWEYERVLTTKKVKWTTFCFLLRIQTKLANLKERGLRLSIPDLHSIHSRLVPNTKHIWTGCLITFDNSTQLFFPDLTEIYFLPGKEIS